jgi:hypothetical protein
MTTPSIKFKWADAWILLSIICASRERGRATLRDIIAVADGIEHAIMNYGEADEGLARLIEAGHVAREGASFHATESVLSAYEAFSEGVPGLIEKLGQLERFLGAEPWSSDYRPPADSSGRVVPRQDFEAAVQSYIVQFK